MLARQPLWIHQRERTGTYWKGHLRVVNLARRVAGIHLQGDGRGRCGNGEGEDDKNNAGQRQPSCELHSRKYYTRRRFFVSRGPFEVILLGSGSVHPFPAAEVTIVSLQAYKVMRPVLNLQNSHNNRDYIALEDS